MAEVRELDQNSPRHPLMRGMEPGRRFEAIALDGYDPPVWLLEHIAKNRAYASAANAYTHPLWAHLAERDPPFPERSAWLTRQLKVHGLMRIDPISEGHAIDLGLGPDDRDSPVYLLPKLDLAPKRFLSLDGMLLLLLLYREAQDAGHRHQAGQFKTALQDAGREWGTQCGYQGEAWDTWQFLVQTRMVEWMPRFQPGLAALTRVERGLRLEYLARCSQRTTKPRLSPEKLKRGRGERRWRRWVLMRASYIQASGEYPDLANGYRNACLLYEWLASHRDAISAHCARAIELLVTGEDSAPTLPPLRMHNDLYVSRRRPPISDLERVVYGARTVFDVVPVEPE